MEREDERNQTKSGRGTPRWREDFPVEWERDSYVTRREFAKFLTLGSALLAAASALIAIVGSSLKTKKSAAVPIGRASEIPDGGSMLFRYPTEDDPCILVRTSSGAIQAYSQVCTHLSCAVVHRQGTDELFCPCHQGCFSATEGRPTAGPPTRRLPRIKLEVRDDTIFAVDREL